MAFDRPAKATTIATTGTVVVLARRGWLIGATMTGAGVLDVYNNASAATTRVVNISAAASITYSVMPPEPVWCDQGITVNITTGGVAGIYYVDAP